MSQGRNVANLNPDSYTALRLQHATPEHVHLTTRRCFIGPVPIGWLRHHRRDWYRHHLHISYSAKAVARDATFHADPGTGRHRRTSEIDGRHSPSFPQPTQIVEEDIHDGESPDSSQPPAEATIEEPPAESIPRSDNPENQPAIDAIAREESSQHSQPSSTSARPPVTNLDTAPTLKPSPSKPPDRRPATPVKSALKSKPKIKPTRSLSAVSFVTARTSFSKTDVDSPDDEEENEARKTDSPTPNAASAVAEEQSSLAPLLNSKPPSETQSNPPEQNKRPAGILKKFKAKVTGQDDDPIDPITIPSAVAFSSEQRGKTGMVRFNIPEDNVQERDHYVRGKLAQLSRRSTLKRLTRTKLQDGEILKVEKMLVRIEYTGHDLPRDFDENDSQKIESRTVEKWKEFIVVCRDSIQDDSEFVLQMYKTRIIQAVEQSRVKRKTAYEIKLKRKTTRIGIFSSLDKTIVVWEPFKTGHRIYIMRPRSGANAMEWFTFVRGLLGSKRPNSLNISIPDLNVNLVLDHPFELLEKSDDMKKAASGDEEALVRTIEEEEAVARNIVRRCLEMLGQAPEWRDIITAWTTAGITPATSAATSTVSLDERLATFKTAGAIGHQPIGLAWKRYDRLEWIHGANERQMYGTIGMERTHELELRPKQHYPTAIKTKSGEQLIEPPPVEGFLIRLTSQRGVEARLGRLFFKRLYFSTHNQYLLFNKPAQADPPPPPKLPMTENAKIPNSQEIVDKTPLIYSVNPYQLQDGRIAWLDVANPKSVEEVAQCDADAFDEAERVVNLLLQCDGNVNLCDIRTVRNMLKGAVPADEHVDDGSDVDFHEDLDEDNEHDDGTVDEVDEDRTFELVLRNGLIIRLQAFNKATKNEWMRRLRALVKYWKLRQTADIGLYKSVRQQNLSALKIDEDMEALLGQFARKWEVSHSYASSELYNICGVSCCRTVTMSGTLYRKPRMHGTFLRNLVILSHGHLMIFQDTLRAITGKKLAHIHHERLTSLDLRDCYVYSGLITGYDLLYTEQAPDSTSRPGHHGLPRMYIEDGWSSTDEDTMTCFVIWHTQRTSWFRSDKSGKDEKRRTRLKKVSQLGVEGKSIVFKARSRAERDHWVINIGMEIERLAKEDDVRIVQQ